MEAVKAETKLDNLGDRARTAANWRFLDTGTSTGLQMVTSIILARLLMPDDFGILALATMVTGLAGVFRDLGLGQALVQRKEIEPVHTTAAFWGALIMGTGMCGLVMAAAPYVGSYFQEPRMAPVLRVISLAFLISPWGAVPRSLLQRELDFKRLFFAGIAGSIFYGAVGISMALMGYSYWSLVVALLTLLVVETIAICVVTGYLPPVIPSLRGIRDLYSFGVGVTGVGLFDYIACQIDYFVIGRRLDASALGLYTRAYQLITYPLSKLSFSLYPVLFPTFSHMQDELERTRRAFGRVLTVLALPSFPALCLLAVTAPELVPLLLGSQWVGAVVPIQILSGVGMLKILENPGGAVVKAQGAVYGELWRQAVRAGLVGMGAWIGVSWGIAGVSWAVLIVGFGSFALGAQLVYSCTRFGPLHYLYAVRGPLLTALATLVVAAATRATAASVGSSPLITLLATVVVGSCVAVAVAVFNPFKEAKEANTEIYAFVKGGMCAVISAVNKR